MPISESLAIYLTIGSDELTDRATRPLTNRILFELFLSCTIIKHSEEASLFLDMCLDCRIYFIEAIEENSGLYS